MSGIFRRTPQPHQRRNIIGALTAPVTDAERDGRDRIVLVVGIAAVGRGRDDPHIAGATAHGSSQAAIRQPPAQDRLGRGTAASPASTTANSAGPRFAWGFGLFGRRVHIRSDRQCLAALVLPRAEARRNLKHNRPGRCQPSPGRSRSGCWARLKISVWMSLACAGHGVAANLAAPSTDMANAGWGLHGRSPLSGTQSINREHPAGRRCRLGFHLGARGVAASQASTTAQSSCVSGVCLGRGGGAENRRRRPAHRAAPAWPTRRRWAQHRRRARPVTLGQGLHGRLESAHRKPGQN